MEHIDTPGKGAVKFGSRDPSIITDAHGLEWVDDENMWVAVPPAQTIYLMDPSTMRVKRSIPTPGARPHGIFLHERELWCADTAMRKVHRLDLENGDILFSPTAGCEAAG